MRHGTRRLALALTVGALCGCAANSQGGIAWNTFWDLLVGAPDEAALAASTRFDGAGVVFDYPAPLRRRESVDEDGDRSWSLEHGMFELEVYAPIHELSGEDYVAMLGSVLGSEGNALSAQAPEPGQTVELCGQLITGSRLRVQIMGDWSEIEAFTLPAPAGESRLLVFDDEPVAGEPSAIARATRERVFATLRCRPPPKLR